MSKDFKHDFQLDSICYLGLDYKKLRVGVIGGGKIGFSKAERFIKNKSYVEVLSESFDERFIKSNNNLVSLIQKSYYKSFINDKNIIIIAVDDKELSKKIADDCMEQFKIFINASDSKNGVAKMPYQKESSNFSFAVNTKKANPRASVLVGEKILNLLESYDTFESFTYKIREKVKGSKNSKEIIRFINTDNFKKAFDENRVEKVLELFLKDLE